MVHFWMAAKIVLKAGGYVLTLGDEFDGGLRIEGLELLVDLVEEEGEVGAAKDNGVDEGILIEEFLKRILDEIVSTRFVELVVLD